MTLNKNLILHRSNFTAMIEITQGNLLTEPAQALVNTVNCVGIMGKDIALQFKDEKKTAFAKRVRKDIDAKGAK
ncbi:hypothetical protein WA1_16575 [Scytonema hofmannii PCC 7110]|uniref:Macro domain-containing protein n=2 Tax=Scytonema hofmannii TaxID=34078 RepID=A0A139XAC8_9CYAN|nr:hypothetical protein WA1_16575 [Scytonema hofmannii PCC 7110]